MLKYKCGVFLLFLFCLCGIQLVGADNNKMPLLGKVIYIDPGHG